MGVVLNQRVGEMFLLTLSLPFMNFSLLAELPASYCELFDMRFCLICEPVDGVNTEKHLISGVSPHIPIISLLLQYSVKEDYAGNSLLFSPE